MQPQTTNIRPIGWYLKEADNLITGFMNASFEIRGITRFHWQILQNIDTHGSICKNNYYPQVKRFLSEQELEQLLASLLTRNWIQLHNEDYTFTETGKQEFDQIAILQQRNKEQMLSGTTSEDYINTINFLSTLILNMGGQV
ncbi:hypothetical protein CLV51_10348 [Chitinophaga niastensis]|uniref:DNA-binding MarR family transcriptional regulator n=1 Tax=Chitinophaga niastensis TaxID=536980 RepID=A0A2P8HIP1_CHINA|nr:hypothetical protein [Chitinophaga niastensis]PSL46072.1 hypothetical protein CLV51_10348 [Chitinophaga niastensis]